MEPIQILVGIALMVVLGSILLRFSRKNPAWHFYVLLGLPAIISLFVTLQEFDLFVFVSTPVGIVSSIASLILLSLWARTLYDVAGEYKDAWFWLIFFVPVAFIFYRIGEIGQ